MKSHRTKRWLVLLASGGFLFTGGTTATNSGCSSFFNSLLGSFTSPGRGGLDTDGDGFTDAQELQAGSDSFDPSSTPNNP